ncbi:MAG TPA: class I SAM-dependent methyltransferase [Candidatus Limnocylindrales bacterium]
MARSSSRDSRAGDETGADLARYYDLDLVDEQSDIDLYLALARGVDEPILELAVGSGRIALPLAAAGHAVTGVDRDRHMLERARRAWQASDAGASGGTLELVEGELTTVSLGARFGLVILGFNGLLMLPGREAQVAALRNVRAHLAPAGRAVIDIWLPTPEDLAAHDGRLELAWRRLDPETGEEVAKSWSARYSPAAAVARIDTFFDAWPVNGGPLRRTARSDVLHLLGASELLDLVQRAGLVPQIVAGDTELGPFGPDSARIVLACGLL